MRRPLISLAGPAVLAAGPLLAAEARAEQPIGEIVVTGQRQARPLAEEPSSVVVLTADSLDELAGADRLEQVLALVPNVQLGSGGEGPTIRGQDGTGALRDLPAFLGGTRPRVAVQVDGRTIGYNELAFAVAGLWDIDQIEVFRSPQTTTQGPNSIAGAIFIKTADPSFDWSGRARVVGGDAATRQASAVVSGPVLADNLAFRVAADVRRSRTSSRISSTAVDADYNRDSYDVVRVKLLATPSGAPGLRLLATGTHNRSSAPQVEGVRLPFRERRDPLATYGLFRVRVDAGTLRGEYDLAKDWHAVTTLSIGDATILRLAPTGFGQARIAARDASFEGVLTWRPNSGVTLLAGLNRSKASLDQTIDLSSALLGQGEFGDQQGSLGLFGQADLQVAPRVHLSAGLRYQSDLQERTGLLGIGNSDPLALDYRRRFARMLPKLTASVELRPGVRVGAQIQRAYNPGGVTLDPRRRVPDTFAPEMLWAYEAFARVFLPDSSVAVSANGFYYGIRNAQRTVQREIPSPAGIVAIVEIDNAPAAYTYGAELQAQWHPSPRLLATASAGLLRTRLTRTLSQVDPLLEREFQRAPHLTASAGLVWAPLPALQISAQVRHNSGYFSDDANTPSRRVGGATVADLNVSFTAAGTTTSFYARNLFDNFYLTYLYSPTARLATAGDPCEIGGAISVRF